MRSFEHFIQKHPKISQRGLLTPARAIQDKWFQWVPTVPNGSQQLTGPGLCAKAGEVCGQGWRRGRKSMTVKNHSSCLNCMPNFVGAQKGGDGFCHF